MSSFVKNCFNQFNFHINHCKCPRCQGLLSTRLQEIYFKSLNYIFSCFRLLAIFFGVYTGIVSTYLWNFEIKIGSALKYINLDGTVQA